MNISRRDFLATSTTAAAAHDGSSLVGPTTSATTSADADDVDAARSVRLRPGDACTG